MGKSRYRHAHYIYFDDEVHNWVKSLPSRQKSQTISNLLKAHILMTNSSTNKIYTLDMHGWFGEFNAILKGLNQNVKKFDQRLTSLERKLDDLA